MPPLRPFRIVLADDHDLVRQGLAALVAGLRDVELVAQARDGRELVRVVENLRPDLVVTDISMPLLDGLAATREITLRFPDVAVLVLTMHADAEMVHQALEAGARGYLLKDSPVSELQEAIASVRYTGRYHSPVVDRLLTQPRAPRASDILTERQLDVLRMLAAGHASKEIAFALGLSSKTVDVHRARIMQKLRLRDVASLTLYALRQGLVRA